MAVTATTSNRMKRQPVAVPVPRIPRWYAFDGIGIAHGYVGQSGPALCGARRFEERYAWPKRMKCVACVSALTPVSESEQRALWGDR